MGSSRQLTIALTTVDAMEKRSTKIIRKVKTPQDRLEDINRYMLKMVGHTGTNLRKSGKMTPRYKAVRWAIWTCSSLFMDIEYKEIAAYFKVTRRSLTYGIEKTLLCFMQPHSGRITGEDMLLIQLLKECPFGTQSQNIHAINREIRHRFDESKDWTGNIEQLFRRSDLEQLPKERLKT